MAWSAPTTGLMVSLLQGPLRHWLQKGSQILPWFPQSLKFTRVDPFLANLPSPSFSQTTVNMVYSIALLGNLLLASAALAAPSSHLAERLQRRREGRQGKPLSPVISDPPEKLVSDVDYSSNWAGAVYESYPSVRCNLSLDAKSSGSTCANFVCLVQRTGLLQIRHCYDQGPHSLGRLWKLWCRLGRHRRRYLRKRHPPDRY